MKYSSLHARYWLGCCLAFIFLLTGCTSASPVNNAASRIVMERLADVVPAEVADLRHSAEETVNYFQEAGLFLNKPVTIVLTRNRQTFLAEAASRFGISEIEANRIGKGVDALSGNSVIVINADGTPTARQRTFLIAHELTHQYQRQLAGAKAGEVKWMTEGMAEAVGAQISANQGFMSIEQYKRNWHQGIANAAKKPSLTELRTAQGWSVSMSVYGSGLTYKTAGLSHLILIEQHGLQSVIKYFEQLGKGQSANDAFRNSFEMDMQQFEQDIELYIRKAA